MQPHCLLTSTLNTDIPTMYKEESYIPTFEPCKEANRKLVNTRGSTTINDPHFSPHKVVRMSTPNSAVITAITLHVCWKRPALAMTTQRYPLSTSTDQDTAPPILVGMQGRGDETSSLVDSTI